LASSQWASGTELPDMRDQACESRWPLEHAYRRLSGAVPAYAAPDQDVCGVDM
jgi:hypothetical protein